MRNELELLRAVSLSKTDIYELSRVFNVGDITEAINLDLILKHHDGRCSLTQRGKDRYTKLSDDKLLRLRLKITTAISVVSLVLSIIALVSGL